MYEQTLPFYLKHTFTLVQYQDEMAFGIMQEPWRYIPDYASFAKVWQAQEGRARDHAGGNLCATQATRSGDENYLRRSAIYSGEQAMKIFGSLK